MNQGAYGLSTKQLVGLALMQSMVQGILIPMLTTFLTTKSDRPPWFRIYVVSVNILTLVQTIIHIIQAFDVISAFHERVVLVVVAPVLTGLIGAAVQAFFIYRCWRIYRQRILATIPLLLLWLVSFVSGTMVGAFLAQSVGRRPYNAIPGANISIAIWVVSSLLFDLITTSSTTIYLYRVRAEISGNRNAFVAVWNIIWASAAPPFVLILITLIDRYIIVNSSGVVGAVAVAMSAKFFVLSLMINLIGQGYIRRQFEPSYPSPPGNSQGSRRASEPVIGGMTAHTVDVELMPRPGPEAISGSDDALGKYHPDDISIKCPSVAKQEGSNLGHTIHNIHLTSKLSS